MFRLNFLAAPPLSIFILNTGENLMPVHLSVFSLVIQPTKRGISVTLPSLVKCTILWMSHSSKILLTTLILQFRGRIASVNRSIGSGHHFSSQTHHSLQIHHPRCSLLCPKIHLSRVQLKPLVISHPHLIPSMINLLPMSIQNIFFFPMMQ